MRIIFGHRIDHNGCGMNMCANIVYDAALLKNNSVRDSLSSTIIPHKRCSTIKTYLFGAKSSLPPIWTDGGSFTYHPTVMTSSFLYSLNKQ